MLLYKWVLKEYVWYDFSRPLEINFAGLPFSRVPMVIIQIVVDVYLCGGLSWLAAGVLSPSTTIDGGRRIIFPLPRGGCQMFLPNLIELSHNNCSL